MFSSTGRSGLVHALRDVTFSVPASQFVCIVGRSGHGKTTLLRVLAGLEQVTSGRVLSSGKEVNRPGNDRGLVFQQDTVFPWMRVRDNVEFGLRSRGIDKARRLRLRTSGSQRWG